MLAPVAELEQVVNGLKLLPHVATDGAESGWLAIKSDPVELAVAKANNERLPRPLSWMRPTRTTP